MTQPDGAALVDSDRAYFELGAVVDALPGAHVAHMVGLEHAAGAVVAHRVDVAAAERDPAGWLSEVEACLARVGAHRGRIYTDQRSPALEAELGRHGYTHRVEHGFAVPPIDARSDVVLEPVDGQRPGVSLLAHDSPDGHDTDPASWVRLHERKAEDPAFTWMTVLDRSGAVLGSVAALRIGGLLRGKNLWIDAPHRRRGVGTAVLVELERVAAEEGRWLGIFAVAGTAGDSFYRALGATPIVDWHEWSRPMVPTYQRRPPKRRSSSGTR